MSHLLVEATKTRTVTILVSESLRRQLEQAAATNERSIGAECRVALKRHLGLDNDDGSEAA
jgi:hypothetical protein